MSSIDEGATIDDDTPSEAKARAALTRMGDPLTEAEIRCASVIGTALGIACTPESPSWVAALYMNVRDLSDALTETLALGEELKTEEPTLKYIRLIRDKLDTIAPPVTI